MSFTLKCLALLSVVGEYAFTNQPCYVITNHVESDLVPHKADCTATGKGVVMSSSCHGDDPSPCTGLTCTNPGEMVGCEHHVCSCVPDHGGHMDGQACMMLSDCANLPDCHHGESMHCVDGKCRCTRM